jgi:hypothetical protein
MSLVKKTVVLSKGATKGYVTLVRVGSDAGAKVVVHDNLDNHVFGIKIGKEIFTAPFSGVRQEYTLNIPFNAGDEIGCIIADKEGAYATGGVRMQIPYDEVEYKLSESDKAEVIEVEAIEAEAAEAEAPVAVEVPVVPKERRIPIFEELAFTPHNGQKNFYYRIKDKLDDILHAYPDDTELMGIIPDSKIVKIAYDDADYYIVGVLTSEGRTTHILYGVPGVKSVQPPASAKGLCQWLPLDNSREYGYWLIFQNAETSEISKADD